MKAAIAAIVLLTGLIVGGLFAAPLLVDAGTWRPTVERQARDLLGLDVAITGEMSFRILPGPRLRAQAVQVRAPGAAELPALLSAGAMDLRLSLPDLLTGAIVVRRVVLQAPVLTLATALNGRSNHVLPVRAASQTRIDRLEIQDGRVVLDDRQRERHGEVAGVDMTVAATAPGGPLRLAGTARVAGRPVRVYGSLARPEAGARLNLDLASDGIGSLRLRGRLGTVDAPGWQGRVEAESADLLAWNGGIAGVAPVAGRLAADVIVAPDRAEFSGLSLRVDGIEAGGRAVLDIAAVPKLVLGLAIEQLDGDALRARLAALADSDGWSGWPAIELPQDVEADLRLDIGVARLGDGVLRQAAFDGSLRRGALSIGRASALLPGGSDIAFTGTFRTPGGAPRLDGSLEAVSDNLRALLDWAAIDTSGIAQARLRHASLSAGINANADVVQVVEIDLRLDQSRIAGGAAIATRRRPSFSLDLRIDRLNADAYLDGLRAAGWLDAGTGLPGTDLLSRFDTNTRLSVDELVAGTRALRDVRLDASLLAGTLTLSDLAIGSVGQASLRMQGQMATGGDARLSLQGTVQGEDAARFLDVLGIGRETAAARLGRFRGEFSVDGNAGSAGFDIDIAAGSGRYRASGTLADALGDWRQESEVSVSGGDLAGVMSVLSPALRWPARLGGDVVIEGRLSGGADAVDFTGRMDALGGRLEAEGRRTTQGTAAAVRLRHGAAGALLRRLVGDQGPALDDGGALEAAARMSAQDDRLSLEGLVVASPQLALSGMATIANLSGRRSVALRLTGGRFDIDGLLDPAAGRPDDGTGPQARRWSLVPLDLLWLGSADVAVAGRVDRVDWSGLTLQDAQVAVSAREGRLQADIAGGTLAGGSIALEATLSGAARPRIATRVRVSGADLALLLAGLGAGPGPRGSIDLEAALAAEGVTPFDLVRDLSGTIALASAGLVVPGQNLSLLSSAATGLTPADVFGNGETVYGPVDGRWRLADGILANDGPVRLGHPSGDVVLVGSIDLPRWRVDLEQRFSLAGQPPFALVIRGPADDPRFEPALP